MKTNSGIYLYSSDSETEYESDSDSCFDSEGNLKYNSPLLDQCFTLSEYIPPEKITKLKPIKIKYNPEEKEFLKLNSRLFDQGKKFQVPTGELFRKISAFDFYNCYVNLAQTREDKNDLRNHFMIVETLKERLNDPSEITLKSANDYNSWFKVCLALKFLFKERYEDKGLKFFLTFSKLSEKYNENEVDKLWKKCNPEYGSMGHVFKYIKKKQKFKNLKKREELIKEKCLGGN